MKYIIDVPNQDYSYDKMLHTLKLKFYDDNLSCEVILDAEPYTEHDREDIENKVWELADYMCKMGVYEKEKCFGFSSTTEVTTNLTFQEAKALFEKWMKSENEIHVGDEIVVNGLRRVVMKLDEKGNVDRYFTSDGKTFGNITGFLNNEVKKTGRHFPEVAELLEKMREHDEEKPE